MAPSRFRRTTLLGAMLVAVASCRSILDIEPGRPLEDSATSAGKGNGGQSNTSAGSSSDGGMAEPVGGAPSTTTAGKGNAGSSKGGTPATAGSASVAGENAGGAGGDPAIQPFPEGPCQSCMARNCPEQTEACLAATGCAAGISSWVECAEELPEDCVTMEPGALQDLEACGAKSCEVCRHTLDDRPSVEILTPSNGAKITLDGTGLIEVAAKVHNFNLKPLGQCGADPNCGHVHFNIDGANCGVNAFFNAWEPDPNPNNGTADADGNADAFLDTTQCDTPITGKSVEIRASLSNSNVHSDRVPLIQSIVTVDIGN
jgi:hypothetical protein